MTDPNGNFSEPPRPRKLPQQSRSRMLVDSVKEACLRILKEKGPRGLTATEIAEVSGVAMGSIYQYFPNVDAIVATVYEGLIEDEVRLAREKQSALRHELTLRDSMSSMIRGTIAFHRRMLHLDSEFHRRFYQTFDLTTWFNRVAGDEYAASRAMYDIIVAHRDECSLYDPEMQSFLVTAVSRGAILDAVKYHPEYLSSPEFVNNVIQLCLSVLGVHDKPE